MTTVFKWREKMNEWQQEVFEQVTDMPIFEDVAVKKLQELVEAGKKVTFEPGSTVFQTGDAGDAYYIIHKGKVTVEIQGDAVESASVVNVMGAGDSFGEMALITDEPRSATIRVIEPATMLQVQSEDFSGLVLEPGVYKKIFSVVCDRLRKRGKQLENAQRVQASLSHFLHKRGDIDDFMLAGETAEVKELKKNVETAAEKDTHILLKGENGTGKGLAALYIVENSQRAGMPMIVIDCADKKVDASAEIFGLSGGDDLLEMDNEMGALELCAGGCVIIENIHSLSGAVQQKLVDTIQTGKFVCEGGGPEKLLAARVIATISEEGLQHSTFKDSEYINLPLLKDRLDDMPDIVNELVKKYCENTDRSEMIIAPDALEKLMGYEWPGNVVELETVISRAVIKSEESAVTISAENILL
jgi:transcriptional regulator with PAS, ATPase and Fis domain